MANLQLRVPKRPRSASPEIAEAFTPRGQTKIAVAVGERVGNGAFGCVFSASVARQNDSVIKRALPGEQQEANLIALKNEKVFYDLLGAHENIMGYRATTPRSGLVMPRAARDMKIVIEKIAKIRNPEQRKIQALELARQMLNALAYLKEKNCFHNDSHLGNWMIGDDGKVKLIDFGLASEKAAEGLIDPAIFYGRNSQESVIADHGVKPINDLSKFQYLFQQTDTEHFPEVEKMKQGLRKIFLFDLNQLILFKYSAEKPRNTRSEPPRAFYEENVKLFLSHRDVNDAGKLDSAYDTPKSEELLKDLYEQRNQPLKPGETLRILRDLMNDPEIYPTRNHCNNQISSR